MADFINKPSKQTRKLFGLVCGIDGNKIIIGHNAKSCGIARKLSMKVYNNQYKVMIPKNRDDIKYLNKHSAPIKWDEKKIINNAFDLQ